jgi:hypothetical protein
MKNAGFNTIVELLAAMFTKEQPKNSLSMTRNLGILWSRTVLLPFFVASQFIHVHHH